jgi:peptidoglycan hydrolase-like protein with peptidoglycan-binding domain
MKNVFITSIIALAVVLGSASVANAALTSYMGVGATGAQVSELQSWLISKGYDIPAISSGAAQKGYFGQQTKAAVQKFQAANGVPSTGFFGPLTMAKVNGGGISMGPISCPPGYDCVLKGGTTPTNPVQGTITTPGVEGTLSASQSNSGLVSTVYEGDKMAAILGIEVEAKNSDIAVQRVKLRMDELTGGADTKFYNKIFKRLYVTDGSTVLASADLNTSNVVKDGSNYYITIAGFSYVVPKNSKRTLVIKADVYENIDSTDYDAESYQLGLAANGLRGVDGAGIDQYAGGASDNAIARTATIAATLTESATITLSLNPASPKKAEVMATAGTNENELDKLHLTTFDLKAEKDDVKVTDLVVNVTKTGSGAATAQTAYIVDASTGAELDSASVSTNTATFSNFDQTITRNSTRSFKILVDIRSANGTVANFAASTTDITSENTRGDSVTESGAALGYTIGVRNSGPQITLVSKSITTAGAPQTSGANNIATSTLTANFVFKIKAVGGPIQFGLTQSTTSPFFASNTPAVGVKSFRIFRNGTEDATITSYATSTSFTFDSLCSTSGLTNTCSLSEGSEITVPVTLSIQGRSATGVLTSGLYSVGIRGLNWSGNSTTFMDGELDWMTPEVSFP